MLSLCHDSVATVAWLPWRTYQGFVALYAAFALESLLLAVLPIARWLGRHSKKGPTPCYPPTVPDPWHNWIGWVEFRIQPIHLPANHATPASFVAENWPRFFRKRAQQATRQIRSYIALDGL